MRHWAFLLGICGLCCFNVPEALAQSANFSNEFGFRSDNDAYLATKQDRYYTNGLFIVFRHAVNRNPGKSKMIWEAEAGQKMYNAQSGYVPNISYVDRPFAAYLYAGAALNYFKAENSVFRIGLQAGTIGPSALGRQAQELLHRIVGFYEINGWQYQVKNAPAINASAMILNRLAGAAGEGADVHLEGTVNLGTTFTDASAAAVIRLGKTNPLTSSALANSRVSGRGDTLPAKEFFFFLKPGLTWVAYDATVQGGLGISDKGPVTFDVKPLVFSQETGLTFAAKRWTADFSVTFLTRQVKSSAKPHQYGSASLFYRFN